MRRRRRDDERSHHPFMLAEEISPAQACRALVERSALTWAELDVLTAAAAGEDTVLAESMTRENAAFALARWRGPTAGLRLVPLAHWGTAIVHGGAPYDPEQRREIAARLINPFIGPDDPDLLDDLDDPDPWS